MKCQILHESRGRLGVQLSCSRMTLRQADVLEYYLKHATARKPFRFSTVPATP